MKKITLYVASFIFATTLVSCGGEKATSLDEELIKIALWSISNFNSNG